jgi:hypothetical protein
VTEEPRAAQEKAPRGRPPTDPRKDRSLRAGLLVLGSAIGHPVGPRGRAPPAAGRAFYFFWSVERVAVALGLDTIGKKDWYAWGAEVLLASQQADGSWLCWRPGISTSPGRAVRPRGQ